MPNMCVRGYAARTVNRVAAPYDTKISCVRSIAAAKRATELGLEAYNILQGFEGDPDPQAQRGKLGGWRFHGLPWRQA